MVPSGFAGGFIFLFVCFWFAFCPEREQKVHVKSERNKTTIQEIHFFFFFISHDVLFRKKHNQTLFFQFSCCLYKRLLWVPCFVYCQRLCYKSLLTGQGCRRGSSLAKGRGVFFFVFQIFCSLAFHQIQLLLAS